MNLQNQKKVAKYPVIKRKVLHFADITKSRLLTAKEMGVKMSAISNQLQSLRVHGWLTWEGDEITMLKEV